MARVKLDTSADTRGAKRLNDELAKTDKELDEISKTARGTARQAQKLAEMADPQKRLNREYAILAKHVKAGRVSMEDAEKIAGKYQHRLDRLGDSGKQAVGPGMLGNITSLTAGYFSVAGAVGVVTKALTEMEQQAQASADATFAGLGSIGELQQISGSPEEFLKNVGFARSLVARGVFKEIGMAADTTFSLGSAGFSDTEKEYLAGLAENKLVKSEGLVDFGGALRKAQGLFPDGISVQDITDRVLATSAATQANATQTALATSQFAAASSELGFKGDDALAGLVLIEEKAKNIDEAATQMANLLDAIDKGGLGKGTFGETIDAIQAQVDEGKGAFDVLGNKRAVKGFRAIASQRGQLESESARIGDSAGAALGSNYLASDPILNAAALKEASEGGLAAARSERYDSKELLYDALRDELKRQMVARGDAGFAQVIMGGLLNINDWTGTEDKMFRQFSDNEDIPAPLRSELVRYLERSAQASERTANAVEGGGGTGRQE